VGQFFINRGCGAVFNTVAEPSRDCRRYMVNMRVVMESFICYQGIDIQRGAVFEDKKRPLRKACGMKKPRRVCLWFSYIKVFTGVRGVCGPVSA
jgi:hypothetical protein